MAKNSWSKSKTDSSWLVRSVAEDPFEDLPKPGDDVKVTKKDGTVVDAKVGKLVWQGKTDDGYAVGLFQSL